VREGLSRLLGRPGDEFSTFFEIHFRLLFHKGVPLAPELTSAFSEKEK
jgi:hypothetical protein